MRMTEAFIRNISDDFACGLGRSDKRDPLYSCGGIDELLNDSRLLREYVESMLSMCKGLSLDSSDPLYHYSKIKCYEAILRNSTQGGK